MANLTEPNIVDDLLVTPFSQRSLADKLMIKDSGRPTPVLSTVKIPGQRSFNSKNWYGKYKWLTGSQRIGKVFCFPCLLFPSNGPQVWCKLGYCDWKNIRRNLEKHQNSYQHSIAEVKLGCLGNQRIDTAISEHIRQQVRLHNEKVDHNRQLIRRLIDIVVHLGTQELAFRGHNESEGSTNKGNYIELMNLLSKYDEQLKSHLEKATVFRGTSTHIQNDLIESINKVLMDLISAEINESPFVGLEFDETTDVSHISQGCFILRYANSLGEICERFFGFTDCTADRDAESIAQLILKTFGHLQGKLVCQTYDGASVMASQLNGVQAKVREVAVYAIFIHCCAHRLNLVLSQSAESIKEVRVFFATISGFPAFFNRSAARTKLLSDIVGRRIPTASVVRWNFKSRICGTVWENRDKLLELFELIMSAEKGWEKDAIKEARGFQRDLNDFEFLFLLLTFKKIFDITDVLFDVLQAKSTDITGCQTHLESAKSQLRRLREETSFDSTYDEILEHVGEPVGRSQSRRRLEGEADNRASFRRIYYQIFDNLFTQFETRFGSLENIRFVSLANPESFKAHAQQFPEFELKSLAASYGSFFDLSRLRSELTAVYNNDVFHQKTILDVLQTFARLKLTVALSEAFKLFQLVATFPITTASAERSFSCLKRIKSFLRSTMCQDRLSSLAMISIEKGLIKSKLQDETFYNAVINHFASLKERRLEFTYK